MGWLEGDADICTRCGEVKPGKVKDRYSFGFYAGRLCPGCCMGFADHCGIDRPQGNPLDLDEHFFKEEVWIT